MWFHEHHLNLGAAGSSVFHDIKELSCPQEVTPWQKPVISKAPATTTAHLNNIAK